MGRKLAIGDVHGCLKSLKLLLKQVKPTKKDTVIFLGDYVDRGPSSKGVLDYLCNWPWDAKLVTLKGNHEFIMEESGNSPEHLSYWCNVGGVQTLKSYGRNFENIPKEHWDFIKNAKAWYETKKVIYVHGGVDSLVPLEEQDPVELSWRRFSNARQHFSKKLVVCGHTIQRKGVPRDIGHSICIDTAACRKGWLTCIHAKSRKFWQANEKGKVRFGVLRPRKRSKAKAKVKIIAR